MVMLESHHWRGLRVSGTQRQTARGARAQSDAADTVLRNSLHACACARLTGSYDNLCPMRQKCRGTGQDLQKLDTLGRSQSDHPVHPLAGIVVGQHHLQAQLLSQHPGNGSAHGVRLPAGGQHQLQAGRTLRAAQRHDYRGELGA